MSEKRKPAPRCCSCQKTLEEVGGFRLVGQYVKAVFVSDKERTGKDLQTKYGPMSCIKLYDGKYLILQGWKDEQMPGIIERATQDYKNGYQSWFCQVCGNRVCSICGSPMTRPAASMILGDEGNTSSISILPVRGGCINPECENYMRPSH